MPCNLAVSITKAAVSEAHLRAILTPEVILPLIEAYLRLPGVLHAERVTLQRQGDAIVVTVGRVTMTIREGRVETQATRGDVRAKELTDGISALVAGIADALFAQQIRAALTPFGTVAAEQVTVDNDGVSQVVTMLTMTLMEGGNAVELTVFTPQQVTVDNDGFSQVVTMLMLHMEGGNAVELKVYVMPGGSVHIFVDGQVSFEQAQAITQAVMAQLQASGIAFREIGTVEQHRDGVSHVHITGGVHVRH